MRYFTLFGILGILSLLTSQGLAGSRVIVTTYVTQGCTTQSGPSKVSPVPHTTTGFTTRQHTNLTSFISTVTTSVNGSTSSVYSTVTATVTTTSVSTISSTSTVIVSMCEAAQRRRRAVADTAAVLPAAAAKSAYPTSILCYRNVTYLTQTWYTATATATTTGLGSTATVLVTTNTTSVVQTTTTVSNVTTSTTISCQTTSTPSIYLAHPTAIAGNAVNGSSDDYDDQYFTVNLPFPIVFYNQSSDNITMTVNGFFLVTGTLDNYGYAPFSNDHLPDSYIRGTSIFPYWDDLFIYQGTKQGLYYEVFGDAPERNVTFEWYTSKYQDSSQYYHFVVQYQEAVPNVIKLVYLDISDGGVSATVGAQSLSNNVSSQYSYNNADIYPGLQLLYDISTNTFDPV